ncbi:MAG TPA: carboxypeptidase-like regulatory domain-containing protein [Vicinamibacterales bacterium]|nr:carboxypeptidase-like regulatory domain-containing protein [Vicinamibacterales bacterium]
MVLALSASVFVAPAISAGPFRSGGRIAGTVVDGTTGRPLAGVIVKLAIDQDKWCEPCLAMAGGPPNVLTVADGKFAFENVAPGAYQVKASKAGYPAGAFGVRRTAGGYPAGIGIGDNDAIEGLIVPLYRPAIIHGTVVDELGAPAVNVCLTFERQTPGTSWLNSDYEDYAERGWEPETRPCTDDRGQYVAMVRAGEYLGSIAFDSRYENYQPVPAARNDDASATYVTTFYPGVRNRDLATPIVVGAGEDRPAVDFRLVAVPTASVSGTLISATAISSVSLTIPGTAYRQEGIVRTGGHFTFTRVPVGQYVLEVASFGNHPFVNIPGRDPVLGWSATAISVGPSGVSDLSIATQRTSTISGVIQSPDLTPAEISHTIIAVVSAGNVLGCVRALAGNEDVTGDRFSAPGVKPGKYRLCVWPPTHPASPGEAVLGTRDLVNVPFEVGAEDISGVVVTVSRRTTAGGGVVRNHLGKLAREGWVVAFPQDPAAWIDPPPGGSRFAAVRVAVNGTYELPALASGGYMLAAVSDDEMNIWPTRPMLTVIAARADRVQLNPGGSITKDVTMRAREPR